MKNLLFTMAAYSFLAAALSIDATAQTGRSRVFSNFDHAGGVRVATHSVPKVKSMPPNPLGVNRAVLAKPAGATASSGNSLVKKTASVRAVATPDKTNPAYAVMQKFSRLMMSKGASLDNFTTGDSKIDSYIAASSVRYNIDPLLILCPRTHQESSFKLKATSNKGAAGLMRMMPETRIRFGVTDIYDPKQNIDAGIKYAAADGSIRERCGAGAGRLQLR